jgi:hypothetical protein
MWQVEQQGLGLVSTFNKYHTPFFPEIRLQVQADGQVEQKNIPCGVRQILSQELKGQLLRGANTGLAIFEKEVYKKAEGEDVHLPIEDELIIGTLGLGELLKKADDGLSSDDKESLEIMIADIIHRIASRAAQDTIMHWAY